MVVDDDPAIADAVAARVRSEGHDVLVVGDGPGALVAAERFDPELVVLDLNLPGLDGIEVCRRLHLQRPVPVLMLTARDHEADVVYGLEVGADDYLAKPFSTRELMARVRAMLRRVERERTAHAAAPLQACGLEIDTGRRTVLRGGQLVHLTPTEFDLVAFLAARPGLVFSRHALLAEVWGYRDGSGARTVDSHVRAVRRKAGDAVIRTVHGVGYGLGLGDDR